MKLRASDELEGHMANERQFKLRTKFIVTHDPDLCRGIGRLLSHGDLLDPISPGATNSP